LARFAGQHSLSTGARPRSVHRRYVERARPAAHPDGGATAGDCAATRHGRPGL